MNQRHVATIVILVLLATPASVVAAHGGEDSDDWVANAKVMSHVNMATGALNLVLVLAQRGNQAAGGIGIASGAVSLLYFGKVLFIEQPEGDEDKLYFLFGTGVATLVIGAYSFKMGRARSSQGRIITVSPELRVPTSSASGYGGVVVRF